MKRPNLSVVIGPYMYRVLWVHGIHPWYWGRLPSRFYLGPVMFYRRPVVG